jgi:protease-4
LILFLLASIGLNLLLILILFFSLFSFGGSSDEGPYLLEKFHAGDSSADDKVAVVQIDGVLMDEMMTYANRQIDKAAKDSAVKAVVVRINSPGGTITASDDVHKRLSELRDGTSPKVTNGVKKPLVVSMGAMAASGGYYIAMPGHDHIFAERTTITGSIGVYVSLPNVHELANKNGVHVNLIRAGDVKAAGSMFHDLLPPERQQWQDMVDDSYSQFLKIVEDGRPQLKGQLTKELTGRTDANGNPRPETAIPRDDKGNPIPDAKPVPYKRKLADGGIFTAQEAQHVKLIDSIGYLEDAATEAAKLANLTKYKVVTYERPVTLFGLLSGGSAKAPAPPDWSKISAAAGPRLWYLAPNAELSGILAAMGKD